MDVWPQRPGEPMNGPTKMKMLTTALLVGLAFVASPASGADNLPTEGPANSPVCGDFKPDNPGTGGDKYTECNMHPTNGRAVNFICANPSENAIEVHANDPDATAKGKLRCGGDLVAACYFQPTCAAAEYWETDADWGTRHDGSCKGGTDEAFDSGMAWACASVGAPVCGGQECAGGNAAEYAVEKAKEAIDDVKNLTAEDALAVLAAITYGVDDLILQFGTIDATEKGFGVHCEAGSCELRGISCLTEKNARTCAVDPRFSL